MNIPLLEAKLSYTFNNQNLIVQALTHPSSHNNAKNNLAYERLEYYGDAIVQLSITEALMSMFPSANEGELTRWRSRVVSRENLASLALLLGLNEQVKISPHEEALGGRNKRSILGNTFETVMGAMAMDSDYATVKPLVLAILKKSLDEVKQNPEDINVKGKLQALLQAIHSEAPRYETDEIPNSNPPRYQSIVSWRGEQLGRGEGLRKKDAEINAAKEALKHSVLR